MTAWWHDLTARERLLIAVAAVFAAVLLLTFAIIRPLNEVRTSAAQRVDAARSGYELTATAAAVSSSAKAFTPDSGIPLRQAVIASASAAGIELIRIGAESEGQIEIQAAPVSGDVLFAWLTLLQNDYGANVAFADITLGDAGLVNPQILVLDR